MSAISKPGILFLEALPTIAGGQTVLVNLVPALRDRYRLATLLPAEGPLAQALRSEGVLCFVAPIGQYSLMHKSLRDVAAYTARLPLLAWRTAQLIRAWDADVVYANSGPTFVWGTLAAQITRCPIVWHHHNLLADGKSLAVVRAASRLPAVRSIVCASAAAQKQLSGAGAKTVVIPNGVDTDRFRPDRAARARIRAELGIDDAAPVVGMVGDLIPLKRQDTLLAALRHVQGEMPELRAILVGDARSGEAESKRYAEQLRSDARNGVLFLGRRSDLPAVLNAFDLLVVASERETGPLVLLEALATGIPVISTPVGRAPELLGPAALYPTGDASTLANLLRSAFATAATPDEARLAARRGAEQKLSLALFHRAIAEVITQALETSPQPASIDQD